jgi:hypothetical protein
MYSGLITINIWQHITKACLMASDNSFIAVAYFSKGAADLLPITAGSTLVVDASERTVKGGLTSPMDLLKLCKKGVRIFSYPGLHAKVFALGDQLYLGSTNVSHNSANGLQEAVISSKDTSLLKDCKKFVKSLCTKDLGIESLKQLQKIYRSPKFHPPLAKNTKRRSNSNGDNVYVVPLVILKRYDTDNNDYIEGRQKAESLIKDANLHIVEDYKASRRSKPKKGDVVIRKTVKEGQYTISPPATIINIKAIRGTNRQYVFVEALNRRDKKLETVNRILKTKELIKGGKKKAELAAKLNSIWK